MTLRSLLTTLILALMPATVQAAIPATLSCREDYSVNWRSSKPVLQPPENYEETGLGAVIVHLDPKSGEWYLELEGSAALTQDGGDFAIARSSGFENYYDEWVGLDDDAMLRIAGAPPELRFVFLSDDSGVVGGTCIEPAEPFLLLAPRKPMP